jgi:hypothetical protein
MAQLMPGDTAVRLAETRLTGIAFPSPFSTLGVTNTAIIIIPFSRPKSRQKGQNMLLFSQNPVETIGF